MSLDSSRAGDRSKKKAFLSRDRKAVMPWGEFHPELGAVGISRGHGEGESRASRTKL